MRIALIIPVALLALMNGEAAEPSVSVCIDRGAGQGAGLPDLQLAQMIAGRIFARIGARIQWRCSGGSDQFIMIATSTNTPDGAHPGALAYAQPFTGGILVFYDRVHNYAPGMRAPLLAHVFAHEITHILQGLARHSETGIMRAHWDKGDFRKMESMGLAFTPYDVLLINQGMAAAMDLRAPRGTEARPPSTAFLLNQAAFANWGAIWWQCGTSIMFRSWRSGN